MSVFSVVAKKEIVDNARDRRALSTALLTPFMGPLMLIVLFFAIREGQDKAREPEVPVVGAEHAAELMGFLSRNNVKVLPPPSDPKQVVRDGDYDVVLRVTPAFGEALRTGKPAVVEMIADPTRQSAAASIDRVSALLSGYGGQIGSLRLLARGVDPGVVSAVRVETIDVSTPSAKKMLLLGSLPLFLLMACFMGGTYIAIDLTAGERERGSLEPLLLNPVSTQQLVLAKTAATMTFCLLSLLAALVAFSLVVPRVPFADIGLDLQMPTRVTAALALLFLPTIALASALQIFVGTISKTTKTAQASIGFLFMIPVAPGLIVSMFPQQPALWNTAVPFLGEAVLSARILRGEDIEVIHWLATAGADLVVAGVLVAVTSRLFGSRMLSS